MAPRRSSFGFLNRFGRSGDLRQLDAALRAVDLHPALVPEGAKLAIVNLMKDYYDQEPPADAYPPVAELVAFCATGPRHFEAANGTEKLAETAARLEEAIEDGDGPDAQLVLLTLHAKLAHPAIVDEYGLSADQV